MQYDLFIQELQKVPCQELRSSDAESFELVVNASDLQKVLLLLQKFFGQPLKPPGAKPSPEAKKVADPFGGIRENQTLYYLASEELYYYSLIWPWSNGESFTVKVIRAS